VSEKYSFIDAEKADYPVVKMCAWLNVRPRASTPGGIDRPRRQRAVGLGWPCPSRRSSTPPTAPTATAASAFGEQARGVDHHLVPLTTQPAVLRRVSPACHGEIDQPLVYGLGLGRSLLTVELIAVPLGASPFQIGPTWAECSLATAVAGRGSAPIAKPFTAQPQQPRTRSSAATKSCARVRQKDRLSCLLPNTRPGASSDLGEGPIMRAPRRICSSPRPPDNTGGLAIQERWRAWGHGYPGERN
jgi:hypothetical protein